MYLFGFIIIIYHDARSSERRKLSPAWHISLLCVQWKTPDEGQRNRPKHVEFYFKNNFEKLVYLFGFIIIIYHDARSSERQMTDAICFHSHNVIITAPVTTTHRSVWLLELWMWISL